MAKKKLNTPALMDVARRAGVGAATVSRVINGGQNVSARTLAAVQKAIAELGYHPNQAARSLKGARTKTIGLIVPSVADPFFSTAAAAIQSVAREHGTLVLLAASENQHARECEQITTLIQRRIDGLILTPTEAAGPEMLRHAGFPVVCFDRPFPGDSIPSVLSDNYGGAKTATEYLVRRGYKRILCLAGDPKLFTSQRRVRGHRDVIRGAGLPYLAALDIQDYASLEAAVTPYLTGKDRIDAIFCIKNAITVDAYKLLHRAGVAIPEKIALLGFDDFDLADTLDPPITVIRQPVEAMATKAAELLFEALERRESRQHPVTLKVELIERGSVLGRRRQGAAASR
jgi:LacI family transcriptional regulator